MKRALALAVMLAVAPAAMAYQVTGPVVQVTDAAIVVEKGKEKWEIRRDANTKVTGDVKKGAKVTVHYIMTATSISGPADKKKDARKDDKKK